MSQRNTLVLLPICLDWKNILFTVSVNGNIIDVSFFGRSLFCVCVSLWSFFLSIFRISLHFPLPKQQLFRINPQPVLVSTVSWKSISLLFLFNKSSYAGLLLFHSLFFSLLFLLVIIFCLDRESKYFKLFLFISAVLLPIFTLNINENSSSFYICQIVSSMELKVIGFDSFFFFLLLFTFVTTTIHTLSLSFPLLCTQGKKNESLLQSRLSTPLSFSPP